MDNKDFNRLKHILDSSKAVSRFISGKERSDLDTDRMLLSAIVREFEIIGEAASQISKEVHSECPDIPWKQMIGMRNRLIHAYFDVDHGVVWITATIELPKLILELERILQ